MHKKLIKDLWKIALPYYKKAEKVSPIAHIEEVMGFANEIAKEELVNTTLVKIYLVACLFHDIGFSDCKLRKIVESEIHQSKYPKKLTKLAIKARLEHMTKGARLTRDILYDYQDKNPIAFFDDNIEEIIRLVKFHDCYKLAKLDGNGSWLTNKDDWLLQLLNEADALWMLTERGIDKDIERGSGFNREEQMQWNTNQHKKIYKSYVLYNRIAGMEFKDKTLYRSKTGYEIFRRLTT